MVKKITKKKKVENNDGFLLTGDKALLLAEGCKINTQKKNIEKRLKVIKKELDLKTPGDYTNSAGDSVSFASVKTYTDIDPQEFYTVMKKKKLSKFFWKCIKVAFGEAKKYLTEAETKNLRSEIDPTNKYTFK